jgi:hypothetical protein
MGETRKSLRRNADRVFDRHAVLGCQLSSFTIFWQTWIAPTLVKWRQRLQHGIAPQAAHEARAWVVDRVQHPPVDQPCVDPHFQMLCQLAALTLVCGWATGLRTMVVTGPVNRISRIRRRILD